MNMYFYDKNISSVELLDQLWFLENGPTHSAWVVNSWNKSLHRQPTRRPETRLESVLGGNVDTREYRSNEFSVLFPKNAGNKTSRDI